ncbi:MAG TPA: dTDP-4-amino-4,6-dideoxygalactose transaminase [Blastocatellia bacterium]|nr:dTDP-4-amino-4,6-dideoxygalactose transaminase [Blastocatellia bacterium]
MKPKIPFNKPFITGKEAGYISQAISSGNIAADGPFTRACARLLEDQYGILRTLMTPSCTAALELAALLCDFAPGDEVIMPSFTFVSTANAVARAGAKPVFVDIRADTLNIDEQLIEAAITPRTRAIMPVHYAGVACEMDRIMALANTHRLIVIEDAAQAVNAFYNGRALGSIGHLGAYSFHDTKNYVSGEGGALCINSKEMVERAEILREKGTNRSQFLRGEVDKYTWVDIGSSFLPSELVCAFLYAQLEAIDEITGQRRKVYEFYREQLSPLEEAGLVSLPYAPQGCELNYHIFHILLADEPTRNALMTHLKQNGISAVFHYVPLHTSPMGAKLGYREGDLPATEDLSGRLLRLPLFPELTPEAQARVVNCVRQFLDQRSESQLAGGRQVR